MLRLFTALAVISISGFLPLDAWPASVFLMAAMWAAAVICGARFEGMLRRLAIFLPFVVAIGLGVPATQSGQWPWTWSLTILCRAMVAFFASLWLVHALPFAELLVLLQRLRAPRVFVQSLAFMHRYSVVLWEELERLKTARRARSSGLSWRRTWMTSAQMIGELLLRAWDRAERVHRAMLARGGEAG
jgi:cobalt/nickel transport system permease protein